MSLNALKWAISQKTGKPLAQLLLITLADMDNAEFGYSWASHKYLAERCQCSRSTVIRNLKALASEGYIVIENRSKDNIKTSNIYRLNVSNRHNETSPDVSNCNKGSIKMTQGGSSRMTHKPLTLSNHLENHLHTFDEFWSQYPKKKK